MRHRRQFLKQAAAASGALAVAPYVITSTALGASDVAPASERIALGFIGVGGHGLGHNLKAFLHQKDAQPVALCDVDAARVDAALQAVRGRFGQKYSCQTTRDWREVIERRNIDAVMISTPDHWHVPMSLAAIRSGKDVICEKPTLTLAEGRLLADTVKRFGTVFQWSTEDRALGVYHRMAELVRNGRIGKLERILVKLPAGPGQPGDPQPKPVPPGFDYEMWLGPAPYAPFRTGLHMFDWRWNRDYSGGQLTDWGAHLLDTAQWANDTERTGPAEIEGTGRRHEKGLYDTYFDYHITYRYASGVVMEVHSGGADLRFEGTEGWIASRGWIGGLQASSDKIRDSAIGPNDPYQVKRPPSEHRNFLDCVKNRRDPYFPAEIGHRCFSVAHLGNIAMDLGRKLRWDPDKELFLGDDTANRMRVRALREPWQL